jgi:phosphoenolpyruvate synthase/pyruvate phosphate dikinase
LIAHIANSAWEKETFNLLQEHGINMMNVKPAVIIQQYIPADYVFTLYTEDPDGLLRIEMSSDRKLDPYVFLYDRNTDELTMKSIERKPRTISFNEDLEVIGETPLQDEISDNWEKFEPLLKKLIHNALNVEAEFGSPQDIEGGFKDGQIYFWQSRNIVKNIT